MEGAYLFKRNGESSRAGKHSQLRKRKVLEKKAHGVGKHLFYGRWEGLLPYKTFPVFLQIPSVLSSRVLG